MSTIAIVGAGNVGRALERGMRAAGHETRLGVRDPGRYAELAHEGVTVVTVEAAVSGADVVVLAVPAAAVPDAVPSLADGQVLVDATNAVGHPVPGGHATMGALVASIAAGRPVVKAFNTIGAEHLDGHPSEGRAVFLPIAGDDRGRPLVAELARSMGFEVADLGGPEAVALVEDHARLWIHLAFRAGWGRDFAFSVVRS